ncbi:MAG: SCPU domain-containing protein [Rickettsiaceae bacterium]|nr:MAG: SCPU domain-containing protein [Rickettsiaceae bacterium]
MVVYKMKNIFQILALIFSISIAQVSCAADQTIMNVTAEVAPVCTIVASNLDFGVYNFSVLNDRANLSIRCTNGAIFRVTIDQGNVIGMINRDSNYKGNILSYELYQDAGMRKKWGNDRNTSFVGQGDGKEHNYMIYGRIPRNQNLPLGTYVANLAISVIIDNTNNIVAYQTTATATVSAKIDDLYGNN